VVETKLHKAPVFSVHPKYIEIVYQPHIIIKQAYNDAGITVQNRTLRFDVRIDVKILSI
jgi:hypothetical protein